MKMLPDLKQYFQDNAKDSLIMRYYGLYSITMPDMDISDGIKFFVCSNIFSGVAKSPGETYIPRERVETFDLKGSCHNRQVRDGSSELLEKVPIKP